MRIDTLFFVFNRPTHTFDVIKSFLEQTKYPESLYVYFDKPILDKDIVLQDMVKEYFQIIKLKNAYYQEQSECKGIKRSIIEAIDVHFEDGADAVIVVEDDIKMHQSCIEYMYAALNQYANASRINTVCAYRYPVLNFIKNKDECLHGMMIKRFNPWGWATWKSKWKFESFVDLKEEILSLDKETQVLPVHLYEYFSMEEFVNGTIDVWSINVVLRQYLMNTYSIYPSKQLVENIGFDSSGVHSSTTQVFTDNVDWTVQYKLNLQMLSLSKVYESELNGFLARHLKEAMFKNNTKEESK
jgi:hypothetical protein